MNIDYKKINDLSYLEKIAKELRKDIIEISYHSKAHHIGSEFSCIDILTALYFNIMNIKSSDPKNINRDWFLLSKGHAVLAQYVVLSKAGFFSKSLLMKEFLSNGGILGGHPDKGSVPGIEMSSGSLGHSLSIGAGLAISNKKDKINSNVFVLIGDGELNEGMIWEAVMFSSHNKLDNLIAIIDYNRLQGFGTTDEILSLDPLKDKFQSFGWYANEINGHNMKEIINSLSILPLKKNKPSVIIANTIKGKGVKSMENKIHSHYEVLSESRYDEIMEELSK